MEIGESVTAPTIGVSDKDVHDESTCPWCQPKKKQGKSKKMAAPNPDDDIVGIPANDGGTLGKNLERAGNSAPLHTVTISYEKTSVLRVKSVHTSSKTGKKVTKFRPVAVVEEGEDTDYEVQYAPHHLIPGNASLKGSGVVPYMGDDESISDYAKGKASEIKKGFYIGYDVNGDQNGEWLPSPYALSMRNDWPADADIKVIKKRRGLDLGPVTEKFKAAYVAASIETYGRQFHMSHDTYSRKVLEILDAAGRRLRLMSDGGKCSKAKKSESKNGKFAPPYGLVARLNVLSNNLRRLVAGPVWRPPLYADGLTEAYVAERVVNKLISESRKKKGKIDKVI